MGSSSAPAAAAELDLQDYAARAIKAIRTWQARWPTFAPHPALVVDESRLDRVMRELEERLADNYPFFHPQYAGQMLKPPSPVAVVAYLMAMLVNPNNHALDGGPATAAMEKEVVPRIAAMFHLPAESLGHLTSSGTIANLEALFVARETHPGQAIAFSEDSHYTHARMCGVLGVRGVKVGVDDQGRMDLDALDQLLETVDVGTVVVTAGTTPLGAIDPIEGVLALRAAHPSLRIHVDAAYAGFFAIPAWAGDESLASFRAIAKCDSVVVDPHKHGLQPYGCGCVIFRDPAVGRFYQHDSPYTYFTSDDLHLGEISLECSRAGAAAAALWATLEMFPLTMEGLGAVISPGRRAARRWAELLRESPRLALYQEPELDIVTYFPRAGTGREIDAASQALFERAEREQLYLSVARVTAEAFARRHPAIDVGGATSIRILRSVLMKPEQERFVEELHRRLEALAS
jgi:glutamate/tyrosine decarboxylase-like PLP-dependent enzyme